MTINQIRPRRETVRAGVLSAAEAAFLANGYERTTVSEIAAAAGFTKGAVYSNFGGKPELLRAVCAAHIDAIADSVSATFAVADESGASPAPDGAPAPEAARAPACCAPSRARARRADHRIVVLARPLDGVPYPGRP